MRALLIYSRCPTTFWSFEKILELVGRKALAPPLSLATVAALLPADWEFRLVDRNVRPVREDEWEWAEIALVTGMIVQRADLHTVVGEARRRGKRVALGGPYATADPEGAAASGADYLVLDEGEITIPLFLDALKRGEGRGVFRSNGLRPDLADAPVPRFDLFELNAYDSMSIQCSRGCPFDCEFCDITALFGRKPRYKTPAQLAAELDALYALGWRRGIFLADDNFIADRRAAWDLAQTLQAWQAARGFPYAFTIQASLNLGRDSDLLKLLAAAGVNAVFLGIASPDEASLRQTRKTVNLRHPLDESVEAIVRAGMRPLGGMILGFDGEEPGAGRRIVDLIDRLAIPESTLMMLQALPQTALWRRLETEGRLRAEGTALDQTQLTNFQPTRPLRELATEFVEAFWQLYDPKAHLDRTHRCFRRMGAPPFKRRPQRPSWAKLRDLAVTMRALATVVWRQGVLRSTRWKFWLYLADILLHNPRVCGHYLSVCAHEEHFLPFRAITRDQILSALAAREAEPAAPSSRPTTPVAAFPR